jgi:riboflavin kinase/FMN adenylyltransferase
MEVLRHPARGDPRLARVVLTLGNFDGVHVGHREILGRAMAVARAGGARAGLLTFHPHPATVLVPDKAPPLIVTPRGKLKLLAEVGIDFVWIVRFSKPFAQLSPEGFIRDYVMSRVGLVGMVVGYNVSFGKDRAGDSDLLIDIGRRLDFGVEIVGPVTRDGLRVSSTAVRNALLRGDVAVAARLLGRPHRIWGRVGHGFKRGRDLGFPTANIELGGGLVPLDGVYAVRVAGLDKDRMGIANIGYKPTFGGTARSLEVHLLDFEGDLYRRRLRVEFVERLRGEVRFASAAELARQIGRDVERARVILSAFASAESVGR